MWLEVLEERDGPARCFTHSNAVLVALDGLEGDHIKVRVQRVASGAGHSVLKQLLASQTAYRFLVDSFQNLLTN